MSFANRIEATELRYEDLSGLDFRGANLQLASFADCDLAGAVFDGARGELFEELAELREREEAFYKVESKLEKLEAERDAAIDKLADAELERDEALANVADLEARLADVEAAQDAQ
jgi:septal ring factor EnvC (AmiA/AmiB activator)